MAKKKPRGFQLHDEATRKAIASRGGKTSQANGNAHKFSSEEGAKAGRKGGKRVAADREHMREIGRRGGLARAARAAEKARGE